MRRFIQFIALAGLIAFVGSNVVEAMPPMPKNNPPMPKNNPPMPKNNPPMPKINLPIIVNIGPKYPPPVVVWPVRPAPIVIVETPVIVREYGMLITEESRTGPASHAGIRVNDIILSVGGQRTQSFEQLASALALANGAVEVAFYNSESKQVEKTLVTPINGRIGIATEPVEIR